MHFLDFFDDQTLAMFIRRFSLISVLLFTLSLIAACGGSGGNVVIEHTPETAKQYDDRDGADDADD